jgi:TonB family protein
MRKISLGAVVAAVLLVCRATQGFAQAPFNPSTVTSASEIPYPIQSIADGVVVVDVSIDDKGAITATAVVRNIPSLTSPATSSIQSWKFSPASSQGKPVPSVMRIAVTFRPRSYLATPPAFTPILSEGLPNRAHQRYVPPGISSVTYPQYPINAVNPATVVVQVMVGKSGAIQRVKVVRDVPPFTQFALTAAHNWRFQAATLDARAITSNITIAFVFASPLTH